jgi:hypothetical protein
MRKAVPAVLQVPPVSQWRLAGDKLETSLVEPPGWRFHVKLLSRTGAVAQPGASYSGPRERLSARVGHRNGQVVEYLRYKLGRPLLSDGNFESGKWGPVGNCAAFPVPVPARLAARVQQGQGLAQMPALALSAEADSACESRLLTWRSGPLFLSLWVRSVSGPGPRICLRETPVNACAPLPPLPQTSSRSRWYHYQTIITPEPGTLSLRLFLYADVYARGTRTTNEYSDVVIRRSADLLQPVVAGTPRSPKRPATALYTSGQSYSPEWVGPPGDAQVEVDGLRNGWLGPHSEDVPPRFGPSLWYSLSRFASLLAAGFLIALALSLWLGGRYRLVKIVRVPSERRIQGSNCGERKRA